MGAGGVAQLREDEFGGALPGRFFGAAVGALDEVSADAGFDGEGFAVLGTGFANDGVAGHGEP